MEELKVENNKLALGLQYTIAQRERLQLLWRLVCKELLITNAETVRDIMKCQLESPAEGFQDIFALLLSHGKRGGYFVEFGACDGLYVSNTLILERKFGWEGILAEPVKLWHDALVSNRISHIDKRCVSSVSGSQIQMHQSVSPGNSSTSIDHPYLGVVNQSYMVETVTLLDLLKCHNAPKYIDFLSVDVEGHEMEVFRNFDFDQYNFGFICVEQHEVHGPENDVTGILNKAGYKVLFSREEGRPIPMQITGVDIWFVPEDGNVSSQWFDAIKDK